MKKAVKLTVFALTLILQMRSMISLFADKLDMDFDYSSSIQNDFNALVLPDVK